MLRRIFPPLCLLKNILTYLLTSSLSAFSLNSFWGHLQVQAAAMCTGWAMAVAAEVGGGAIVFVAWNHILTVATSAAVILSKWLNIPQKHDAEGHVSGGNPEKPRRFGSLVKLQIMITYVTKATSLKTSSRNDINKNEHYHYSESQRHKSCFSISSVKMHNGKKWLIGGGDFVNKSQMTWMFFVYVNWI